MNITELKVGYKVVYSPTATEKQVAVIKAIAKEGIVIIRDSFGEIKEVAPEKITKMIGPI